MQDEILSVGGMNRLLVVVLMLRPHSNGTQSENAALTWFMLTKVDLKQYAKSYVSSVQLSSPEL